ncbi:DUF4236 domain-containing protein [Paraburkholderia sediminicola]|uniref:DUF4236 domain-containing protein n=1 Tax=Paraburkholderia sediminicola TaxID=458836 RepID=UPI0038BA52C2
MGWGFRKSIKIAPGIRINLSKSGISASLGGKGFTYNPVAASPQVFREPESDIRQV